MRSGPGEARTILRFHIISARPPKQPLMVRTFLKVYMELGSSLLFLQEQIKDIIIISISHSRVPKEIKGIIIINVYLTVGSFLFLKEQIKGIIIITYQGLNLPTNQQGEIVLFIGTQFSNLYTSVHTPA